MADSLFSSNVTLPPLPPLRASENGSNAQEVAATEEDEELARTIKDIRLETGEEPEVLDYEGDFDALGDGLDESGDDLNDETFGDVEIGKDFDFSGSTAKLASTIGEEETYMGKKPAMTAGHELPAPRRPSYAKLWEDAPPVSSSSAAMNGQSNADGQPTLTDAPISPPIWGLFSASHVRKDSQSHSQDVGVRPSFNGSPHYMQSPLQLPLHPQQQSQASPRAGSSIRAPMSFDEIEAQLHRQAGQGMSSGHEKRMLSLAEVEAALLSGRQPAPPQMYNQTGPPIRELERWHDQEERTRLEKHRKIAEMAKYNGLMTQSDKDFINRIQISQLLNDDSYADDFYCKVYTALRNRQPPHQFTAQAGPAYGYDRRHRSRGSESGLGKMHAQVMRIVNDVQHKPKQTQLSLEGALGKIAVNTVRNPKQLLQVTTKSGDHHHHHHHQHHHHHHAASTNTITSVGEVGGHQKTPSLSTYGNVDRKKVLRSIEDVYMAVLRLEELRHHQPPPPRPFYEREQEAAERWHAEYDKVAKQMWEDLCVQEPMGTSYPHPFINILSVSKGKKVIPRVLRYCLPDQILSLITVLVTNFESLDVCKSGWDATGHIDHSVLDEVELFMNVVVPPLVQFVAEARMFVVIGLAALLIDRNNVVWLAKTKVGLAFLTMLLSRAEFLKGGGAVQAMPTPEELLQWQDTYSRLFNMLQNSFLSLFPPSNSGVDDAYVWQFLASMAVGAGSEQQHILVSEVRNRVIEMVIQANNAPDDKASITKIANVNLFLHALGLDAAQLDKTQLNVA